MIEQNDAPAVTLVDDLLTKAIEAQASDIHLEPTEDDLRMRFRIDGVLYDQSPIESNLMDQVISRIKVLAHINIAEKRIPQDGKFKLIKHNQPIDLRISSFPSLYGEKVAVRILDRAHNNIALDELGQSKELLATFKRLIDRSSGFFLVTGPTGSGKTTTLYSALSYINSPEKNIITLEDPVEYSVDGITQGQINPEAGFTFEKGIRSLLRQDPDILMIGEIRDRQTARIAIEAALTGHVVLSTLHTNDAPSAVMRLMDMGIEPFLLNAAVTGVLAQRLARKICPHCKIEVSPNEQEQALLKRLGLNLKKIVKGQGCDHCLQLGYKGRVGIFELLVMSDALRALIVKYPRFEAIYKQALSDGMHTLLDDGVQKIKQGLLSVHEVARTIL